MHVPITCCHVGQCSFSAIELCYCSSYSMKVATKVKCLPFSYNDTLMEVLLTVYCFRVLIKKYCFRVMNVAFIYSTVFFLILTS